MAYLTIDQTPILGSMHSMQVIGIDPGLATIGIGLVERTDSKECAVLDWMTIETKAGTALPDRLHEIAEDLDTLLGQFTPDLAAIEKLYFSTNEKTAIDVAQARGVILQIVASHSIEILEPTPMQLKAQITGDGRADKKQVQTMLMHMFNLQEPPQPDDAADALALAVYGALAHATPVLHGA